MCQSLRNGLVNLQTEKSLLLISGKYKVLFLLTPESVQEGIILE